MIKMLVCDFIVDFFIRKGITDVFGYPGGMVTYLLDSLSKNKDKINTHTNYHEQASAFAACGYAQVKGIPGVAFATSGPGATNLITGIANAFFDSIPTIFITGQVNTYEAKENLKIRQRGFQETDIVSVCKPIVKYAVNINNAENIVYELEKAYHLAMTVRQGPVLLDIPMNIQRTEINLDKCKKFDLPEEKSINYEEIIDFIVRKIKNSRKPVFILGNGISKDIKTKAFLQEFVKKSELPITTSMIAIDNFTKDYEYNMGFIGAYGNRTANFAVMKSDLIITLGARLDCRQVSVRRDTFAPKAEIIRIDIDENELMYKVHEDDVSFKVDVNEIIKHLNRYKDNLKLIEHDEWRKYCKLLKEKLSQYDKEPGNIIVEKISDLFDENTVITTDVGQNQVWVAQSLKTKRNQKVLFSGGHGAMGYSLPAAIGAYYASHKNVICFCGDGGLQMNIQELQFIKENNLPIKIVLFNNQSLGMIRHFQEMYFNSNFTQTKINKGYSVPDFTKIVEAYGIRAVRVKTQNDLEKLKSIINDNKSVLIDITLPDTTYVFPKLAINKPINDQEPEMDRKLFNELMEKI